MKGHDISNSDDVIDSRDVIARIEALESELQGEWEVAVGESDESRTFDQWLAKVAEDDAHDQQDDAKELKSLKAMADEADGYASDWKHGEALIRETYFTEYCQQLVEDIGDLPKDVPSYLEIDWEKTARNLRVDYTEVDYDGVTYLIR